MWRAMFLAFGFFLMIVGAECLGVESVAESPRGAAGAGRPLGHRGEGRGVPTDRAAPLGPLEPALLRRGRVPLLLHHSPASGRRVRDERLEMRD